MGFFGFMFPCGVMFPQGVATPIGKTHVMSSHRDISRSYPLRKNQKPEKRHLVGGI